MSIYLHFIDTQKQNETKELLKENKHGFTLLKLSWEYWDVLVFHLIVYIVTSEFLICVFWTCFLPIHNSTHFIRLLLHIQVHAYMHPYHNIGNTFSVVWIHQTELHYSLCIDKYTYSYGQKFTYTCKENVYRDRLEFQWFLQLSFFCDEIDGTHTTFSEKHSWSLVQ